ncbi:MAG: hypothetical protein MJ221_03965, partial [Bacilli bacterium]|nr:hypothetical protein [Bacilli bacterium]
ITSIVGEYGNHNLAHHDASDGDCKNKGNIEYWDCSVCEKKYSDANATTEVTDVTTDYGNHNFVNDECTICGHINDDKFISTVGSINSWSKGDLNFGWYQYGGQDGTTISVTEGYDVSKSKEADGAYKKVSISGEGSTKDRIYSLYFKLNKHKTALGLVNPTAISFVVYNEVKGGGLLFKAGSEITTGIKAYDANNDLVVENNRELDFVGLRRYVINLSSEQFGQNELEIGIWGASLSTVVDFSAFSFIDSGLKQVSLGNTSSLVFTNFAQECQMTKSFVETDKTVDADGKALKVTRQETGSWAAANIYLQKQKLLDGMSPKIMKFTVYNQIKIDDYANNGLAFKAGTEASCINVYQSLDFTGFRTFAFPLPSDLSQINEFQIFVWGQAAAEIFISGFQVVNAL